MQKTVSRRIALALLPLLCGVSSAQTLSFQTKYAKLVIERDGKVAGIFNRSNGENCALAPQENAFASITHHGEIIPATAAIGTADGFSLTFGSSGVSAGLKVSSRGSYFEFEVISISDDTVHEFTFLDIHLVPQKPGSTFAMAAIAMNLHTHVPALPGMGDRLLAKCTARFGLVGAKVGIIAAPVGKMRSIMKDVVYAAREDVPYSPYGGPWAMDHPFNRGSYIVDCTQMRDDTVDKWIQICSDTGIKQLDFSNWNFLNGEYEVNREFIPGGKEELARIVKRLHRAGIRCGLHTYSFLVARNSQRYVTPNPDPRLLKGAQFSLAAALNETATDVLLEPGPSTTSLGAGVIVQIDNELITIGDLTKAPPYTLTGCTRGSLGTKPAPHHAAATVAELRQVFGVFIPDVQTTLFKEIAANLARTCNEYGFDMMYLDAVDSYSQLDGPENGWYWATLFVNEIVKQLKQPVILEGSTLWHGLWFARSRMGAWDVPIRAEKECYDAHFVDNLYYEETFLPTHLGWCDVHPWNPVQPERTFIDDIEYLLCKGMAADCGMSMQAYLNPENYMKSENAQRIGKLIGTYEKLRAKHYFPESIRRKLAISGADYTLAQDRGKWFFRPLSYAKHKVSGNDRSTYAWDIDNSYEAQPTRIRIEALMSIDPYDSPDGKLFTDYTNGTFDKPAQVQGMASSSFTIGSFPELGRSESLARFKATSNDPMAWTMYKAVLVYTMDCSVKGLGVWVYGDGQGEILNLQNTSAPSYSSGYSDHYVKVDFSGWRYVELVEPETREISRYDWPMVSRKSDWAYTEKGPAPTSPRLPPSATAYTFYVMSGAINMVSSCGIWYNNLPIGKEVTTYLSPIRALPLRHAKLRDPVVAIGGSTITFPVSLESGQYLEYHSVSDCRVYDADGKTIASVMPLGEPPVARAGSNEVTFNCTSGDGPMPRANVTIITKGSPILR